MTRCASVLLKNFRFTMFPIIIIHIDPFFLISPTSFYYRTIVPYYTVPLHITPPQCFVPYPGKLLYMPYHGRWEPKRHAKQTSLLGYPPDGSRP
jgi:hypothetical protein